MRVATVAVDSSPSVKRAALRTGRSTGVCTDDQPMTRNQLTLLVVLAALAGLFVIKPAVRSQREEHGKAGAALGLLDTKPQPLPSSRLMNLNRQEMPVDVLRRGRVLLVFLTTNCDPCVKEAQVISRLHRDVKPGLHVYGIGIERPAQIATFVDEFGLQFPMLIDVNANLARSLDVHHFPSKYLIEDGMVTKVWRGKTQDEVALRQQLGME